MTLAEVTFIDDAKANGSDDGAYADALKFPPFIDWDRDGVIFRNWMPSGAPGRDRLNVGPLHHRSHPPVNDAPAVTDQRPLDAGERSGDAAPFALTVRTPHSSTDKPKGQHDHER